jgi:hypothetical protein
MVCYVTLGWKGLPKTNTLAYWAHSQVVKKMKCCECGLWLLWPLFKQITTVTNDRSKIH